jgi:hypothetical protein
MLRDKITKLHDLIDSRVRQPLDQLIPAFLKLVDIADSRDYVVKRVSTGMDN